MLLSWLVVFCCAFVSVFSSDEVTVDIPQGKLKGLKTMTVTSHKPYYSFKGIPFAKPMVGPNKFDQPQPAEPWAGVLDATQHRAKCPYYCMIEKGIMGEEDCLYLNVYTTDLNQEAKKAVMVWIPSGGYNAGAGNDDMFGPDFLIDQDVVLVTFNYRLGAIGFLNTLDENAPGNAGLKDQVMVLRWIQNNIQYFGGCPNRVTLFGHSSGSASVQLHMLSPMSKGLFKSAIMQSGSAVNTWSMNRAPKETAFKLGKVLNINAKNTKDLLSGLKKKSAGELITASQEIAKDLNMMNGMWNAFVPSVEADVGQEIFLPSDPWVLTKSGDLVDVPVIFGTTSEEGAFVTPMMMDNADFLNSHFENFIPDDLNITDAAKKKALATEMKKFYLNGKDISTDTTPEFINLMSDILFIAQTIIIGKVIAARNKSPVYEYLFTYESPFGIIKNIHGLDKYVAHGDETGYQFYATAFKNKPEAGSDSEKVMKKMTKMWTNFAKDGNPTSKMDTDVDVQWDPMGKDDKYMKINADLKLEQGFLTDRIKFWLQKYKDILGDYASLAN